MNGVNCNSTNNFLIKAIVFFSLATIVFYLLTEHRAHLLAYSSYILFIGYILLHFFMCGRHGKHGEHGEHGGHCKHGHGEHKHEEAEKRDQNTQNTQNTGKHEDVDWREY